MNNKKQKSKHKVKLDVETSVFDDATCEDIFGKMYGRVALFNSHVAAYYYWKISEMKGEIGRDNVLVLVDAHPDCEDGLKRNLPVFKSDKPLEEKIKDFKEYFLDLYTYHPGKEIQPLIHCANFIWAGVEDGLIQEVYWIVPNMQVEHAGRFFKNPFVFYDGKKIPFHIRTLETLEYLDIENVLLTVDLDYFYFGVFNDVKSGKIKMDLFSNYLPGFFRELKIKIGNVKGVIPAATTKGLFGLTPKEQGSLEKVVVRELQKF